MSFLQSLIQIPYSCYILFQRMSTILFTFLVFTFVCFWHMHKLASDLLPLSLSGGAYGVGVGPIYLKGLLCRGNETNLFQCQSSGFLEGYICSHFDDAAVICPREEHTTSKNSVLYMSFKWRLSFSC